jgi:acyl carrier protein
MSVRAQVKNFVLKNYLFTEDESALADSDSLLEKGAMDSTGILELIMFLEEQFGLIVADDEMIPANLDSIASVVNFVERKRASG